MIAEEAGRFFISGNLADQGMENRIGNKADGEEFMP
jgi:hypothetical protein